MMMKTHNAQSEMDDIRLGVDPSFDALLRSLEQERGSALPPRVAPAPSLPRDPYYLD